MSNTTKQNLEASLKKVMLQKPLDKITISDITSDCGISRKKESNLSFNGGKNIQPDFTAT